MDIRETPHVSIHIYTMFAYCGRKRQGEILLGAPHIYANFSVCLSSYMDKKTFCKFHLQHRHRSNHCSKEHSQIKFLQMESGENSRYNSKFVCSCSYHFFSYFGNFNYGGMLEMFSETTYKCNSNGCNVTEELKSSFF